MSRMVTPEAHRRPSPHSVCRGAGDITAAVVEPVVTKWLPPRMLDCPDFTKMRITCVDGVSQLYGHKRSDRHLIDHMSVVFKDIYGLEDPEDSKNTWNVGEACTAKLGRTWYRAKVVEVSQSNKELGILYVDLGNVRIVNIKDLRIPRAFGEEVCRSLSINFTFRKD